MNTCDEEAADLEGWTGGFVGFEGCCSLYAGPGHPVNALKTLQTQFKCSAQQAKHVGRRREVSNCRPLKVCCLCWQQLTRGLVASQYIVSCMQTKTTCIQVHSCQHRHSISSVICSNKLHMQTTSAAMSNCRKYLKADQAVVLIQTSGNAGHLSDCRVIMTDTGQLLRSRTACCFGWAVLVIAKALD